MKLKTKALYNLLRFSSIHNPSIIVKKWQVEDLREISDLEIFKKLELVGIFLDKEKFIAYSNEVESPEDLIELISDAKDMEIRDQVYLLLFEAWRRFLSARQTVSIFCDELDQRIFKYDNGEFENDEFIQDALANLKYILDSNVDSGMSAYEAFNTLMQYSAHDLENFIYDYISDQIDYKNDTYANELVDGFYPYAHKKNWFYFLKARLFAIQDVAQANEIIKEISEKLFSHPNLNLQFRILEFMTEIGDRDLFIKIVKQTAENINTEKEFTHLMKIVADFYNRLDKEEMERQIVDILNSRLEKNPKEKISKNDKDLKDFTNLVS